MENQRSTQYPELCSCLFNPDNYYYAVREVMPGAY